MIKVYGIKSCGSVKKALSFFKTHNIECELCDFKAEKLSCDKISSWLRHVDMKTLFNSKSTTYKRPIVEFDEKVIVGFDEAIYKGVFL